MSFRIMWIYASLTGDSCHIVNFVGFTEKESSLSEVKKWKAAHVNNPRSLPHTYHDNHSTALKQSSSGLLFDKWWSRIQNCHFFGLRIESDYQLFKTDHFWQIGKAVAANFSYKFLSYLRPMRWGGWRWRPSSCRRATSCRSCPTSPSAVSRHSSTLPWKKGSSRFEYRHRRVLPRIVHTVRLIKHFSIMCRVVRWWKTQIIV